MSMRKNRVLYLASAVALAAACGSDEEPAAEQTKGEFCDQWAEAACTDDVVKYCQAEDVDARRQSQEAFCTDLVPDGFFDGASGECIAAVKQAYSDGELSGDALLRAAVARRRAGRARRC